MTQELIEGHLLAPDEWTPDRAAAYVTEAWQNAVESIIETGRRLIEAKGRVGHGSWLATVELLPFGVRTAQSLMQIAQHPDIANAQYVAHLPPSWGTLSTLAQLPVGEIPRRIEAHEITPELERSTAQSWVGAYAVGRQEELTAYGRFADAVLTALSYAKTYQPPADTDTYPDVQDVITEIRQLADITQTWET